MSSFQKWSWVFLILCMPLTAAAQEPTSVVQAPQSASEALARYEQLLSGTAGQAKRLYLITKIAPTALAAGETAKATAYSQSLLSQAPEMPNDWNYGNAIHVAHLVLGHIALSSGDVAEAKRQLLQAGDTTGSPQLNSFGPNMRLAQELLAKEEREVVLQYFELCAKFWGDRQGLLKKWKSMILEGAKPDFGANLGYGLEVWHYDNWNKLQE